VIARPNVIVGVHLDGDASRLYANFHGGSNDPPVRDVRRILEMRLAELEVWSGPYATCSQLINQSVPNSYSSTMRASA